MRNTRWNLPVKEKNRKTLMLCYSLVKENKTENAQKELKVLTFYQTRRKDHGYWVNLYWLSDRPHPVSSCSSPRKKFRVPRWNRASNNRMFTCRLFFSLCLFFLTKIRGGGIKKVRKKKGNKKSPQALRRTLKAKVEGKFHALTPNFFPTYFGFWRARWTWQKSSDCSLSTFQRQHAK